VYEMIDKLTTGKCSTKTFGSLMRASCGLVTGLL